MCLVLFSGGVSQTLGIFFVEQNLHADPRIYGLLGSASGVGLIAGAVIASWGVQRLGLMRALWINTILLGAMEIVYAQTTDIRLAVAILFLQGVPNAVLNVTLGPLVLFVTPRTYIGRAWALLMPAMNAATVISTFLAGYLTSTVLRTFDVTILGISWNSIGTMIALAGTLTLVAGIYAMSQAKILTKYHYDSSSVK